MSIFPSNSSPASGGDNPPILIVRGSSDAGVAGVVLVAGLGGEKSALSGALTANILKTVLRIDGAGILKCCAVQSLDATSRTMRLKITVDGNEVFNPGASAASTTTNIAVVGVGGITTYNASNLMLAFERVPFNKSCLVEIASSLTETDKLALLYAYDLE